MKPLLIALGWLAFAGSLAGAPAAGPTRHRFLDHEFVREAQCAALVVNPPKSSEIVIRADKPWEQFMITFYLSVIDDGGKIRMWYVCRDKEKKGSLAYAESADGVNWVKPDLGVVDYHGSRAHNLLGVRNLEGTVFRDEHAANPQERYVYVSSVGKGGGIFRFTSPEGYTWKRDKAPLLPFEADSQKVTFWDSRLGKYVATSAAGTWRNSPLVRTAKLSASSRAPRPFQRDRSFAPTRPVAANRHDSRSVRV